MRLLKKAIFATLGYYDIFDYPLKTKEIYKFLFQIKQPEPEVKSCLQELEKDKKIIKQGQFYFFPGRKKIVALRKKRECYSQEKLKVAQQTARLFSFLPWVKMIVLTGGLAMANADQDDDIDFLVVAGRNRLWLTRLLMVVVLEVLGRRRRPKNKDIKNKICLNMFLDETALGLTSKKHNLFTAHEIVQTKPVFNKGQTYERFLRKNQWVEKYLPNSIELGQFKNVKINQKKKKAFAVFNFLEKLAYQLQLKYMKARKTSEQVSPNFAFFHLKDRGKKILKKYEKKITSG